MENSGEQQPQPSSPRFMHFSMLLTAIGLCLMSMFVFGILGGFIALGITGVSPEEMVKSMTATEASPGAIMAFKIMQLAASFGGFIFSGFIFLRLFRINMADHLGLREKVSVRNILLVVLLGLAMLPLISFLQELNQGWSLSGLWQDAQQSFEESQKQNEDIYLKFLQADTIGGLIFNLILIALVPAVGEELFFRGILFPIFWGWTRNKHFGVIFSALLFAVIHRQFFNVLPITFMGILFGYLYVWSGSLKLPIVAHFINNALVVVMMYWAQNGGPEFLTMDYTFPWWAAIPSALVSGVIAWWFYRQYQQQHKHE